jgi:hypothetical protein
MAKLMLLVFATFTGLAVYATTANWGVMDPSITKQSVRSASARGPGFIHIGGGPRVK